MRIGDMRVLHCAHCYEQFVLFIRTLEDVYVACVVCVWMC